MPTHSTTSKCTILRDCRLTSAASFPQLAAVSSQSDSLSWIVSCGQRQPNIKGILIFLATLQQVVGKAK